MNFTEYKTLTASSKGEYRDSGSKFFGYAFPIQSPEDWQEHLSHIKKEHPKARHHCFAYRYGLDGNNFRTYDDGEPSGTAGKPILGQIDSHQLTNVFIVVVRYFGGTLLGTSGLIQAYRNAAADAILKSEIVKRQVMNVYELRFDYAIMGELLDMLKKEDVQILKQEFAVHPCLEIAVPKASDRQFFISLYAGLEKVSHVEAEKLQNINGLEVTFRYTL